MLNPSGYSGVNKGRARRAMIALAKYKGLKNPATSCIMQGEMKENSCVPNKTIGLSDQPDA